MINKKSIIAELFKDPYAVYGKLRSSDPVLIKSDDDLSTKGMWLFSRYEDVKQIFELSTSISKNIALARGAGPVSVFELNMINMDGEDHIKSRNLLSSFFGKKNLINISTVIEKIIDECLADNKNSQIIDLVENYSEIIPVKVVMKLLGLPAEDSEMIRMWSLAMSPSFDSFQQQRPEMLENRIKILKELCQYIQYQMKKAQSLPEGSLLKYLCEKHASNEISENHALGAAILILFAGHETTISLIGNSLYLLLSHPDQWSRVCNDTNLIPAAIEEVLRFESPAQRSTFRVATSTVLIGGQLVEPGQQLSALIGAANRDERVYENADHFDIDRKFVRNHSFGGGAHVCLGQMLARMETKMAVEKIIKKYPNLRLMSEKPLWRKNSFFRQLQTLQAISK